jgi:hypothetical protein
VDEWPSGRGPEKANTKLQTTIRKAPPLERVQCGGRFDLTDTVDFLIALMSYGESTVERGSLPGISKSRSFFIEMDGIRYE